MSNRCPAIEIAHLVDFLSRTAGQGPHLAREIREGGVTVLRGQIERSVDLGVLKHGWRAMSTPQGPDGIQVRHLIVQNSLDGLRSWNTEAGRIHVGRIRDRMEALLQGAMPGPLVLGWDGADWVLQDGNYTAAALYHTWVARTPKPILVYVLRPIVWRSTVLPAVFAESRV